MPENIHNLKTANLDVDIIGYDCGWGCGDFGCEDGPAGIDLSQIMHDLRDRGTAPQLHAPLGLKRLARHEDLDTKEKTLPVLRECLSRLSRAAADSAGKNRLPLIIGGDHSSGIGTWSGVVHARGLHQRFGLIWIDAHLDCHTFETSYQGKFGGWWHGQPITALCGHGLPDFTRLCDSLQKISPRHVSIIGAHSYEPAEKDFIDRHGIRLFSLDEVEKRGFKAVFAEAMARATDGTGGFGLSIDLDAFGPEDAPGVGTAEDRGLKAAEVLPVLESLGHRSGLYGIEIVEYNPSNDVDYRTARLVREMARRIFKKLS